MEKYISRCIQVAKNGLGKTFPNPMVGSVIVYNDMIIGEGSTSSYGGAHAEVNAINSVKDKSLLSKATLYVTLEPCSHHGKTPPCADLIIENKIPKVVIGTLDPHQKVAGKGANRLREAGCEVVLGVLEDECRQHHKRFLSFHQKQRPYIILKWAETKDGFIAPDESMRSETAKPFWITNEHSRQLVHKWRSEEQAILVGTNTVLLDNPKLSVRHWRGTSPIRVILDQHSKINETYHVRDNSIRTIVLKGNGEMVQTGGNTIYETVDFNNNLPLQVCDILYNHAIVSVIIEGGRQTIQSFINEGLWDEARVFIGATKFGKGLEAPLISGDTMPDQRILGDVLKLYSND